MEGKGVLVGLVVRGVLEVTLWLLVGTPVLLVALLGLLVSKMAMIINDLFLTPLERLARKLSGIMKTILQRLIGG
jgi:uncharacterized membrane protein